MPEVGFSPKGGPIRQLADRTLALLTPVVLAMESPTMNHESDGSDNDPSKCYRRERGCRGNCHPGLLSSVRTMSAPMMLTSRNQMMPITDADSRLPSPVNGSNTEKMAPAAPRLDTKNSTTSKNLLIFTAPSLELKMIRLAQLQ